MTNADAVVEICRRLDGIPLAIELAASRMLSMTVTEVRDRLDDRFRLLVGSRRGLERHQTLRHAVQWSYDLLDDAERTLLNRCSVFAGGFDLASACAITGAGDEFATLDLLDALVRKSLLVADRSTRRTRFSMLETIRQFAEEQLVASGEADDVRAAHARYFAGREADVLAQWDSRTTTRVLRLVHPRVGESARCLSMGCRPRRSRLRRGYRRMRVDSRILGRAVRTRCVGRGDHRARAQASNTDGWPSSMRWPRDATRPVVSTRASRYAEAGLQAIDSGRFDQCRLRSRSELGGIYILKGEPQRWIELCRNTIADEHGCAHLDPGVPGGDADNDRRHG